MTGSYSPLNRNQSRQIDTIAVEEYGMNGLQLMENAGRSLCDLLETLGLGGTTVICCGKGNNGGDGFVLARHLANRGHGVRVLLFAKAEELQGDAATNYAILRHCDAPIEEVAQIDDSIEDTLQAAGWVVDALLGTGVTGNPRPPLDAAVRAINHSGNKVLAVDIPTGLDCDSGQPGEPCVKALHTGTFVTSKVGFEQEAAKPYTGKVHVLDIGVPRRVVGRMLERSPQQ